MTKKKHNDSKKIYYGTKIEKTQTYLEFGSINKKNYKKNIWDRRVDQDAYDLFMVSRYAKEIVAYQECLTYLKLKRYKKVESIYSNDIHTQDFLNSIITWSALTLFKKNNLKLNFFEIGFTLFGAIEAHQLVKQILKKGPTVKQINYDGIEISNFIARLATLLHKNYNTSYELSNKNIKKNIGIFFSKGVTLLYAINKVKEFFFYLDRSKIVIFDYNFSLSGKNQSGVLGTGKKVIYLDLNKVIVEAKKKSKALLVRKSDMFLDKKRKRMRCYCLWGDEYFLKLLLTDLSSNLKIIKSQVPKRLFKKLTNNYNGKPETDYTNILDLNIEN